jgi:AcrR family transcriptional regulator
VVDDAIALTDAEGLGAVSMRVLAKRLGIGAVTLYSYVENRNDLVVLMVDQAFGGRQLPAMPVSLREGLRLVAEVQLADWREHPWLLEVAVLRPWLGPHVGDRYAWQLSSLEGVGLDDVEMDQTVTLVVGFAANVARSEHAVRQAEK